MSNVFDTLRNNLSNPKLLVTDVDNYPDYFKDAMVDTARPGAILFAESDDDIKACLQFCRENNYPVVPRGAGTGLSGGCVPLDNAIVLSLERMNELEIDIENRMAHVQVGAITKDIQDLAAQFGLTYLPDPASYDESTIGGNIAENAGGLRCVKYGVTKDYILGLKAYTISGEYIQTGIYAEKDGFEIQDLLIGSEGTLAVISEAALQLAPLPPSGETILAAFPSSESAARAVSNIRREGITPIVMEFLDGDAAACSNEYEKNDWLDQSVGAILIIEAERDDADIIISHCNKNRTVYMKRAHEVSDADQLWKVRRNLSKAAKAIGKIRISEDIAVPISKFPEVVAFVAEMNKHSPLRINSFGHAGDGNLHVNFLSMSGSTEDRELIELEIDRLMAKTVELGGTVTGEHGIGLAKRKYLPLEFGKATIASMKMYKSVFDPAGLLNPGKIF